jgi:hypothetical protein
MKKPVKASYKITNWRKYNESLVNRGSITFWFDEETLAHWEHDNTESKVGRPFTYSDRAIEVLLVLRELFQLPYRQTEGLGRSLLSLMQIDVPVPDFTSLAKRAAKLNIDLSVTRRKGAIDIVVDSTGLKVFGDGEWKVRKYGAGKHRTWRKLHLAINPETQEIVAETLTENSSIDSSQAPALLAQVPSKIQSFRGDGAYDKWLVYESLAARGITPIIPPQKNAKIKRHGNALGPVLPRDATIRCIRKIGRSEWKRQVGYHQRSLAETAMHRMKMTFGGELKNRNLDNQRTEARLRCKILNHHISLGLPPSKWN